MKKSIGIIILFLLLGISSYAQKENFKKCLLHYNEVNNRGVEQDVIAFGWFEELPFIPSYTYYDRDAKRKVTIKTRITPYENEDLADVKNMSILADSYGVLIGKCKQSDKEVEILDLKKLHADFIGASLALEIKLNPQKKTYTFESYPFEDEFPFKYEEDIVKTVFTIKELEKLCSE
jgi:hypothetical protein